LDSTSVFPAINAGLNGACAVLLALGRIYIGRKQISTHRKLMIAAFTTSCAFLLSYLYYHFVIRQGMPTRFQGQGIFRTAYFVLLSTHTMLAAVMVPMILVTLRRGLQRNDATHRRIARWTYPIWMYVSVTGVVIYLMLYHW
jgi:putative membrane protein